MVRDFPVHKLRAAIYCRVSTDEQARNGFSLEAQQESCMRYVKEFGHDLFKIYVDDGYSAKNLKRPALQEMLDDIRNKRIDIVVIWRLDRLTRRTIDGLDMVYEIFNKYGVSFATITERHDLSTAQGRWMFTVSLANAQNERELNGERVVFGQAKKANKGLRVSLGPIYGYDKLLGKLVVNESEANTVRRIFDLYVYKSWGYAKIAAELNADPNAPAKKTVWWPNTIKGILKNVTYIGRNTWRGVTNDGEHDAIVDVDLFELAQTRLKRRGDLEMSRSSYSYPFSTVMKCGDCGASYNAYYTKKTDDSKPYCNYRCANKKPGLCSASDIAEIKFEKLFFNYFSKLVTVEDNNYTPGPSKEEIKQVEKERSRIEREITKLNKRKANLLDDLGDRVITRDEYKTNIDKVNLRLSELHKEMNLIEPEEVAATASPQDIIDLMKNLESDWEHMDHPDRKFVIQHMFKRIVIQKNTEWEIKQVDPA